MTRPPSEPGTRTALWLRDVLEAIFRPLFDSTLLIYPASTHTPPAPNSMPWWRSLLCFKHEAIEMCENEETTKPSHQIRIFSITSSEQTKKYKIPRKDRKGTLRLMKHLEQRSRDFWDDSDLQSPAGHFKTHDQQRKQRLLELGHVCFLKQKAYQHYLAVQKAAKMDIKGEGIMSATMGRMLLRDARGKASKAMGEYVSAHEMYGLYLRGIGLEYVQSR